MKIRMAALLGSTAALLAVPAAQAAAPATQSQQPLAASSYAELLEPVPNAVQALEADNSAQQPARMQLAQYHHHHHHYHHHHHHHHHGGFFPGFAVGAAIGGMMAASPPPDYRYGRSVRWCMQHYRSYDPRSETYMGYDGRRHSCP